MTPLRQLMMRTSLISCCHVQERGILVSKIRSEKGMSSTGTGKSHLERTDAKPRDPDDPHKVIVSHIAAISPTVKEVVLSSAVTPVPFSFKAGQWVDLHIPGISKIGGFTISSSPELLKRTGSFHLAIQESTAAPAHWVHTTCQVNDQVSIRVGGDFFFDPEREQGTQGLLLIAGGVGINPLSSIIKEIHGGDRPGIPTVLLFSAKTQEHLFKEEFETLMKQNRNFVCKFFVTGRTAASNDNNSQFQTGRIGVTEIQDALRTLSAKDGVELDKVKVYICGPPPMTESMEEMTRKLNVTNIAVEKWW